MTIHSNMFDRDRERYSSSVVWYGVWKSPIGMTLTGFHVWDVQGRWVGVYKTQSRAKSEAHSLP